MVCWSMFNDWLSEEKQPLFCSACNVCDISTYPIHDFKLSV